VKPYSVFGKTAEEANHLGVPEILKISNRKLKIIKKFS
jgi:hypothetical protein